MDTSLEKPTLLEEFLAFFSARGRDLQRWDKAREGLVTIVLRKDGVRVGLPTWRPSSITIFNGKIHVNHCPNGGVLLSKDQKTELETWLTSRIKYFKENAGNFNYIGKMLSSPYTIACFCEECQVRFALEINFANEKVPRLLEQLQRV